MTLGQSCLGDGPPNPRANDDRPRARLRPWRPGISSLAWRSVGFDPGKHLPQAARTGFEAIELCLFGDRQEFDYEDASKIRELRRAADAEGLAVWSIHAPRPTGDLGSPEPARRQMGIDVLRKCLDVADTLGSGIVVSHALAEPGAAADAEGRCAESLAKLASIIEAAAARIGFENSLPDCPSSSVTNIARRLEGMPSRAFGCVLDTGHAHVARELDEVADAWGERLISVHLHDNNGVRDNHYPPGQGGIDWDAVRRILQETRYRGCLLYEDDELVGGARDPQLLLEATIQAHRTLFGGD
ncbi:MAG: sugar phosphate isomerase/epimerase family protein [Planctomycetota bacterium]